jgi:predicted Abi (CAAX) family protease
MSQPATTERTAGDYVLSKQSDLNHPDAFPLIQDTPAAHYRPLADWLGRLILPERMQRRDDRGIWFEVYHAPETRRALVTCAAPACTVPSPPEYSQPSSRAAQTDQAR